MHSNSVDNAQAKAKKCKGQSGAAMIVRRMMRNKVAMTGFILLAVMGILSILSPYICKYGYAEMNIMDAFQGSSMKHFLGTDDMGRDLFSRILYGGRYSLSIGFLSVSIACSCGIVIGAVAGFFGGKIDNIIMRVIDVLQAFPPLIMAICVAAALGTGFVKTCIALGISGIPGYARMMRAQILTVRTNEYVEAAEAMNCSFFRTIRRHVIPNCFSPIIVTITMQLGQCIIAAASLSYLGLGVQPPEPEWGALLTGAKKYIRDYPYMIMYPGLAIMISVLSFNMIGDTLRDAIDPKLKQ